MSVDDTGSLQWGRRYTNPRESVHEPDSRTAHHLALADEWRAVVEAGEDYCRSTVGRSLEEEGFIHTSSSGPGEGTARAYYQNLDVVLLGDRPRGRSFTHPAR
ncbi:MAG: DUF952 domain-containing protein [Microthrixaceae bacterium]